MCEMVNLKKDEGCVTQVPRTLVLTMIPEITINSQQVQLL